MDKITILVTGANGQLGSEIKVLANAFSQFSFIFSDVDNLDITKYEDLNEFFTQHRIDYIVNCAAYTNVDNAENDHVNAKHINVDAVENLKNIANKFGSKLIHISTDYVFDAADQNTPFKEKDLPMAKSVYGSTKLEGETLLHESDNAIIIRTSWLYSSFGHNFVKTMRRLGNERNKLTVIFDQIGTPTYAADLAQAILQIINFSEKNEVFKHGIYHFSNEGVCSWYDFAVEIMRLSNLKCSVLPIETKDYPTPAKRPAYSVLNKGKIKTAFNLTIPHWTSSLKKCINIMNG